MSKKLFLIKTTKELNKTDSVETFDKELGAAWKITPEKIYDVDYAIVLKEGVCIGVFKLGDKMSYDKVEGRTTVELTECDDEELKNKFFGKKFNYKTPNPATVKDAAEFYDTILD